MNNNGYLAVNPMCHSVINLKEKALILLYKLN